ncbi:sugar transferase [Alkalicoccobacillus gibsonii]|uniref:Sugar transferase n=1 Tax=Alkalicoccobacillus gibsonii TaxID=79881 RepID=A0ABU9VM21_9BACI
MEETSSRSVVKNASLEGKFIINDTPTYLLMKRAIDILASLTGIILLSPLFALLAILIKLEDPKGKVFFQQVRIGKDEKEFNMYKFRSMVSNAEELLNELLEKNEVSGAMFKIRKDPRITKIGKFIRKSSLDELPQLFNVLKGEMTLVGPRPPLPREVLKYTSYHKKRLLGKPGCTGVWQVSARNNVGFDEMIEMDIKYLSERNVTSDLVIIFKTVIVMICSRAY